ncbi:unnamed protein product [Allacma fusca]|uniref:Secreted protein n=1 Tax=Allacma fusca TaxID=39272 RepID=A0A8J2LJA5_9HEXA|nr:unnamed protein product [Allacma fusca]
MISWDLVLVLIYFSSTSYCREYHIASRYLNHLNDSENKYLIYPSFNQCTNADNLRLQVDFPVPSHIYFTLRHTGLDCTLLCQ